MQVDTGAFSALTDRLDDLAARVEQVAEEACKVRLFDQIRFGALGYADAPRPAVKAPRHLHAIDGGAS